MNKVLHIFIGADFRCQQKGLLEHAKQRKCKPLTKYGEHYFFVNRNMNAVKTLSFGGHTKAGQLRVLLGYLRLVDEVSQEDLQIFAKAWCASDITLGSREKMVIRAKQNAAKAA